MNILGDAGDVPESAQSGHGVVGRLSVAEAREFLSPDNPAWFKEYANCLGVDPLIFAAESGEEVDLAKQVCNGCGVREDCLEYALSHKENKSTWGGKTEKERRRIQRFRSIANIFLNMRDSRV